MSYIRTPEHKARMAEIKKGQKHSEEARRKISINHHDVSGEKNPFYGKHRTKEEKEKLRLLRLGKKHPNYKPPMAGKKHSEEYKKLMSERFKGENGPGWKGGLTELNRIIRSSARYKEWRTSVFVRDGRKCVICGSTKDINADHLKSFSEYPEFRFDVDNGRTLCVLCHQETHNFGWRAMWKKRKKINNAPCFV